jgi:hypothetical protein
MRVGPFDIQVGLIPSPVLRLESLGDLWFKRERVILLDAAPPVAEKRLGPLAPDDLAHF